MQELLTKRSRSAGLPPGTLVTVAREERRETRITLIDYDAGRIDETPIETPEACRETLARPGVKWINVCGLTDTALLSRVGTVFDIHPLVLEDIVNTGQRPKLEEDDNRIFFVVRMLYHAQDNSGILAEQVSIIVGQNYVLSFQETEDDVFNLIRERLRSAKGRIRSMGADYLAYALLDAIVDNYFVILEDVGEEIETLQDTVLSKPEPSTLQQIHHIKNQMIFLRKSLWPLREVVGALEKSESALITSSIQPYLRDVYEHTIQVIDTVESLRDVISGTLDIYLSSVSNRMNEVMRVLTVIATLFIPLTFVAGIYGMNFQHMPELSWRYGYAATWVVMLAIAAGMLLYFRRKNWF